MPAASTSRPELAASERMPRLPLPTPTVSLRAARKRADRTEREAAPCLRALPAKVCVRAELSTATDARPLQTFSQVSEPPKRATLLKDPPEHRSQPRSAA